MSPNNIKKSEQGLKREDPIGLNYQSLYEQYRKMLLQEHKQSKVINRSMNDLLFNVLSVVGLVWRNVSLWIDW